MQVSRGPSENGNESLQGKPHLPTYLDEVAEGMGESGLECLYLRIVLSCTQQGARTVALACKFTSKVPPYRIPPWLSTLTSMP
jgi:hypothetical protein